MPNETVEGSGQVSEEWIIPSCWREGDRHSANCLTIRKAGRTTQRRHQRANPQAGTKKWDVASNNLAQQWHHHGFELALLGRLLGRSVGKVGRTTTHQHTTIGSKRLRGVLPCLDAHSLEVGWRKATKMQECLIFIIRRLVLRARLQEYKWFRHTP